MVALLTGLRAGPGLLGWPWLMQCSSALYDMACSMPAPLQAVNKVKVPCWHAGSPDNQEAALDALSSFEHCVSPCLLTNFQAKLINVFWHEVL